MVSRRHLHSFLPSAILWLRAIVRLAVPLYFPGWRRSLESRNNYPILASHRVPVAFLGSWLPPVASIQFAVFRRRLI
jgi:hypothetical protein